MDQDEIDQILNDIQYSFFLDSYHSLIEIGMNQQLPPMEVQRLLCLACYSWMPTMLKNMTDELFILDVRGISSHQEALTYLQNTVDDPLVNNSWVGTSKVLHFINPNHFPIWDSKVAKSLESQGVSAFIPYSPYRMSLKDRYIAYCEKIYELDGDETVVTDILAERTEMFYGYSPSRLRCIEFMLYIGHVLYDDGVRIVA